MSSPKRCPSTGLKLRVADNCTNNTMEVTRFGRNTCDLETCSSTHELPGIIYLSQLGCTIPFDNTYNKAMGFAHRMKPAHFREHVKVEVSSSSRDQPQV